MKNSPSCQCCKCPVHAETTGNIDSANWDLSGGASVSAGKIILPTGGMAISKLGLPAYGHRALATVSQGDDVDLIVQYSDSDNFNFNRLAWAGTAKLFRRIAGSETQLASVTFPSFTGNAGAFACFTGKPGDYINGLLQGDGNLSTYKVRAESPERGTRAGVRNTAATSVDVLQFFSWKNYGESTDPLCVCSCRCITDDGPFAPVEWDLTFKGWQIPPSTPYGDFDITATCSSTACKWEEIGGGPSGESTEVRLIPSGGSTLGLRVTVTGFPSGGSAQWDATLTYSAESWYPTLTKTLTLTTDAQSDWVLTGSTVVAVGAIPQWP